MTTKTHRPLYIIGLLLTLIAVITGIGALIADASCFSSWEVSLSLCAALFAGTVLMLAGAQKPSE